MNKIPVLEYLQKQLDGTLTRRQQPIGNTPLLYQ